MDYGDPLYPLLDTRYTSISHQLQYTLMGWFCLPLRMYNPMSTKIFNNLNVKEYGGAPSASIKYLICCSNYFLLWFQCLSSLTSAWLTNVTISLCQLVVTNEPVQYMYMQCHTTQKSWYAGQTFCRYNYETEVFNPL